MFYLVAAITRLFGRDRPIQRAVEDRKPVTLRDPAWLIRSSGWAPVAAVRGAEPSERAA